LLKRAGLSVAIVFYYAVLSGTIPKIFTFNQHCDQVARSMSSAQVKYWGRDHTGRSVIIDDHWQGYNWMNDNTPKDARVMAWWDYGYQITGIGRRTSLADGNTWNHEQIATLGKFLSGPQKKSWNALRHLADYVLVWTGGPQDDLAISTHFARIGNSVFPDHCGDDDPTCRKFGFQGPGRYDNPTKMMRESLVYNLVKDGKDGVKANEKLFQMVYESPRGMMRIFKIVNTSQESKDWIEDPANRICDAPGSWYCVGQYPPAVQKLVSSRRSFSQVEDFNKKGEKSAYTKMIEQQQRGGKMSPDL
jgi:dolichyl-diphosphooligosaccharide--protein glycosyltransferase